MSLPIRKDQEVVKANVTFDTTSTYWPRLFKILWKVLKNPMKCPVQEPSLHHPVPHHRLLGGMQMLQGVLGMFCIALLEQYQDSSTSNISELGFVFITSGMLSFLAEECPHRCLTGLSAAMNLLAAAVALTGIGLYITNLGAVLATVMIILAVLQILVSTSAAVFAMETMRHQRNNEEKEEEKPLLKEYLGGSVEKDLSIFHFQKAYSDVLRSLNTYSNIGNN